jgi:hypothetical protein
MALNSRIGGFMNTEDRKVLNEKIARWIGYVKTNDSGYLKYPDNIQKEGCRIIHKSSLRFTDSMDACIKEIIPELRKRIYPDYLNIQFGYEAENITCGIQGNDCIEIFGYGDTESEAFCLALEKYIDSEGK